MTDVTSTPMRGLRPIERALLSTASMLAFTRVSSHLPVMAAQLVAVLRAISAMPDGDQNEVVFGPLGSVHLRAMDVVRTFNAERMPDVEQRLRDRYDAMHRLSDALATFFVRRAEMDLRAAAVVVAPRDMKCVAVEERDKRSRHG